MRRWCSACAGPGLAPRQSTALHGPDAAALALRFRQPGLVRLLDAIGVDYARRYISHFGFDESELPPNLSISLGTPSLTPLDVTRGYAVFANGGFRVTPWFIDQVRDRNGELVFEANPARACRGCGAGALPGQPVAQARPHVVDGFDFGPASPAPSPDPAPAPEAAGDRRRCAGRDGSSCARDDQEFIVAPRAIDERVAWQLVSMMRDVVRRGTGRAALALERDDIGGKTGSTNDYRDAWFVGFGGNLVTAVWVGRDDNRSLGRREYGGRAALPIWIDYMDVALEGQPAMPHDLPDGMVEVSVSAGGRLLPPGSGGQTEYIRSRTWSGCRPRSMTASTTPCRPRKCSTSSDWPATATARGVTRIGLQSA